MSGSGLVESLFHEALGLPADADRVDWLESRCQGDSDLFQDVCSLLDAHARMLMSEPIGPRPASAAAVPAAQFGVYRAVSLLGCGGMSAVYLAERADGRFHMKVALKVMAPYLAGQEFLRRFETERQLLATFSHNHITRILDGGVSSAGDPYLVTEYVDGLPLDRYCDEHRLDVNARLRIFLQVCDAVDCAHRNLVVHRDLKPANILVNTEREAKLLDFGTAALLAGTAEVTATRMRMLTPRYASPEQLRGDPVKITSDLFSLGVILYELLTGAWPYGDPNSILRELDRCTGNLAADPPAGAITEQAAQSRSITREHLRRALQGDLSAIVLKAMEFDPSRRYESVRALAEDLENYLAGRPVDARPQTVVYRARKFLRRHWLAVAAAAVFVAGLASAAIVAFHQAQVARAEALRAERVNDFLNGMLSSPSQLSFDPQKFTVVEMLNAAEARLEKDWKGDALTEATIRRSIGEAYRDMTRFDRARPQLEKSVAILQKLGDQEKLAYSLFDLAALAGLEGRNEEAGQDFRKVLEIGKRQGASFPAILTFDTKNRLGTGLWLMGGQRDEARILLDQAIALGVRDNSIPRIALATAMASRAGLLGDEGKKSEAEVMYRQALEIGRKEDPDGYWQATPLHFMALLIASKDPAGANELARQAYQVCEHALGPNHPDTAAAKLFWMRGRIETGDLIDAGDVLSTIDIVRKHYGQSMNLWVALVSSDAILDRLGRFPEAELEAREMLPILDANGLSPQDARRAQTWMLLGRALHDQKKNFDAAAAIEKAVAIYDAAGPGGTAPGRKARELLSEIRSQSESR